MKYRCLPIGLCSWDFRIVHDATVVARTHHDWLTEQGSLEIGARRLSVVKPSAMIGGWSVQEDGATIASALKPSAFARRFNVTDSGGDYELAANVMSRRFDLRKDGAAVVSIAPDHLLTRRSSIQADDSVRIELMTFAFWLSVICWRRAARSSSAGG